MMPRAADYEDRLLAVDLHRNGVEFAAKPNDRVRAIGPGEVVLVGALPGFERVVVVDHGGGYLSLTARLLTITVSEGEQIEAGTVLGRVGPKAIAGGLGTTAYVEIRHGQRPIDPAPYLRSRSRQEARAHALAGVDRRVPGRRLSARGRSGSPSRTPRRRPCR